LQEKLAARVEHEHVHGAVFQPEPVNFAARLLPSNLVAVVDDIKDFFSHGSRSNQF
jgi:hypothetical protein